MYNTLFFQSALCRQSAVETKSQNQGQSGTRQGQIGTRVGQIGTGEGQIGTGEGQLEISYRVLETWFIVKYDVENMYSLYLVPFEYIIQIFEKVYMQLIC